ncbi:phosphoadenylyl-sulfate reductase [Yeosuana sp. MJ-SS3]|uniref:Adenosine 5'-phosphosulfate reductase n=1 Tax=Gilvirhabdus luticola TaxID=3079858 RepID=A0ABU3U2R9_9FLAO|nr:phosphoadenylyl-sulfate reductase [Yeosuana sp. MJ-SS3]MDU8884646.1 phosphoadenylyl-sulfate reductase [Yeosuana sp. MJ-SS3]
MLDFSKEVNEIKQEIRKFLNQKKRIFLTSSFQSHSIPLLHIIATLELKVDIYFINTGFHFVETHVFKNKVSSMLGLEVKTIESPIPKINQKDKNGFFYYTSNTNYCCHLNKVLPTNDLLNEYDVWISGVRKDQSSFRKNLQKIEKTPNGKLRYHPMLNWNSKLIYQYRQKYHLPEHPLESLGYFSIGCQPCTVNVSNINIEDGRDSRWFGQNKMECGLHTNLIEKK